MSLAAVFQPALTKDWRHFTPAGSTVITEASWKRRDALASRYYPNVADLLQLPDSDIKRILAEVESDVRPARWLGLSGRSGRPVASLPSRTNIEWHLFRGVAPAARRPSISPHLRDLVIVRDGFTCGICGGPVDPNDVHLDHIVPHSKGGPTTAKNLRVTHSRCNLRRGDGE